MRAEYKKYCILLFLNVQTENQSKADKRYSIISLHHTCWTRLRYQIYNQFVTHVDVQIAEHKLQFASRNASVLVPIQQIESCPQVCWDKYSRFSLIEHSISSRRIYTITIVNQPILSPVAKLSLPSSLYVSSAIVPNSVRNTHDSTKLRAETINVVVVNKRLFSNTLVFHSFDFHLITSPQRCYLMSSHVHTPIHYLLSPSACVKCVCGNCPVSSYRKSQPTQTCAHNNEMK